MNQPTVCIESCSTDMSRRYCTKGVLQPVWATHRHDNQYYRAWLHITTRIWSA